MRATLLRLVALRDALLEDGAPPSQLHELTTLVRRLMKVLRARGELCGCHPDCLDESFAPLD